MIEPEKDLGPIVLYEDGVKVLDAELIVEGNAELRSISKPKAEQRTGGSRVGNLCATSTTNEEAA